MTAAGLLGLGIVASLASGPAAADLPRSPCFAPYTASSAADLLVLRDVDLTALGNGASGQDSSGVLLGSSRAGLFAGPDPQAAARAGLIAPDAYIYQTAPPSDDPPVTRRLAPATGAGVHTGAQRLRTAATLRDATRCDDDTGPAAAASLSLEDDATVEAHGTPILRVISGSGTRAESGFMHREDAHSAVATSSATIAGLELFGTITVRVTGASTLRASASEVQGTSGIEFTPSALEIAMAGDAGSPTVQRPAPVDRIAPVRLSAPIDLIAPIDPSDIAEAAAVANGRHASLLPATAFRDTLAALGINGAAAPQGKDAVAVFRISQGSVAQQNLGYRVHAVATVLRLQVLVLTPGSTGRGTERQVAEFAIGSIEALACAPPGDIDLSGTAGRGARPAGQDADRVVAPAARALKIRSTGTATRIDDNSNLKEDSTETSADADISGHTDPVVRADHRGNGGQGAGDHTMNRTTASSGTSESSRGPRTALIAVAGLSLILLGRVAAILSVCPARLRRSSRQRG